MPYSTINDLPENVKSHLPRHALEIYRSAFNHAWDEYRLSKKRNTSDSQEVIAHKVAWTAVKRIYHKDPTTQKWVKSL